jgi:hypothetical protein
MSEFASSRFDRWIRGTGIVALVALASAVFVPDGFFWTAVLAAGLIGSAVVTAVVVRRRNVPSLAQVIASAVAEPGVATARRGHTSGAGLRSRGERKP